MTDIAKLRKLLEQATTREWEQGWKRSESGEAPYRREIYGGLPGRPQIAAEIASPDSELIVAAVNALSELLDDLDKAEEHRKDSRYVIERLSEERDDLKTMKSQLILDHIASEGEWIEWTRKIKAENVALKAEVERQRAKGCQAEQYCDCGNGPGCRD